MGNLASSKSYLYIAWITALLATAASIYFIEILGYPSAALCWFERMLMFGVLLVLTVGIFRKDNNTRYFALPFLILGILSATFQQLIHWRVITINSASCGVTFNSNALICNTKFFELFGFITQATLCLGAFLIIAFCLYQYRSK